MENIVVLLLYLGGVVYLNKGMGLALSARRAMVGSLALFILGGMCHLLALDQFGFGPLYFMYTFVSMILVILAISDLITLTLPLDLIGLGLVVASIALMTGGTSDWSMNLVAALVGFGLLFGLSKLLRGGIGDGDAYVLAFLILTLGLSHGLIVFMVALVLSALTGIALLVFGGKSKKTVLPFVPFIALAHIGLLIF